MSNVKYINFGEGMEYSVDENKIIRSISIYDERNKLTLELPNTDENILISVDKVFAFEMSQEKVEELMFSWLAIVCPERLLFDKDE